MASEIFIVEDESIVSLEIQDRIKQLGYSISGTAASGEDALEKLGSCSADLVIMDIRLRGKLDGIETAGLIKKKFDLPVIFLTAYADENTLQRAKITEPYAYIIKPFEERELQTNIEIALYKHRAEKEIREKDQWLSIILRSIGDAVIATDKNKKIIFMNDVAERLTRFRSYESIGQPLESIFKLLNDFTGEPFPNPVEDVLNFGKLITFDEYATLVSRYGSLRPIMGTAAPIKDENSNVLGIVIVFQDISERVKAEIAVKASEKKFKAIVENSPGIVFLYSSKRGGLYFSPRVTDLLFYTNNDLLNDPYLYFNSTDPSEKEKIFDLLLHIQENEVISFEHKIKDARGNWKWLDTKAVCLEKIGDEVILQCVADDITEKKFIDEKISLQTSALNSASNGILIADSNGKIFYCNRSMTEMTGYSIDEMIGQNPRIFKSDEQPDSFYADLWQTIKSGVVWHGELVNRRKNGSTYYEDITITPVTDEWNNITHFIAIKHDITGRKKFENELVLAKEQAEKSNQIKSEFLAQMSHEIRTPVNNILSFSSLIFSELEGNLDEDLKAGFDAIERGGRRLIRTIDLLLNMSSVQSGSYEAKITILKISDDIIIPCISEFKKFAEAKKLDLILEDNLNEFKYIKGDEYSVTQILSNLLDNALKYTNSGNVIISVARNDAANKILLKVTDSGIGIAEEYLPNLFNPFSQEEQGYTRRFEGNGLGLSLVKKYCEINDADISVESRKGKGTTFTVSFDSPPIQSFKPE